MSKEQLLSVIKELLHATSFSLPLDDNHPAVIRAKAALREAEGEEES